MLFKKKKKQILVCLDSNGNLIRSSELQELPLNEDYILRTSKNEYQNDEPCIIIRTSIAGDVYNRLCKFLQNAAAHSESVALKDLPEEFQTCIDWEPAVQSIRMQEA